MSKTKIFLKLIALYWLMSSSCLAQVNSMINSTLDEDLNNDGQLSPGDSLDYEVIISTSSISIINSQLRIQTSQFLNILPGTVNVLPYAVSDFRAMGENDTVPLTGNMLANDAGQDPGETLQILAINSITTPGVLVGMYGALTWQRNGSYSYVLDTTNTIVDALDNGQSVVETFTYQSGDGSGETDTATLEIRIDGISDSGQLLLPHQAKTHFLAFYNPDLLNMQSESHLIARGWNS